MRPGRAHMWTGGTAFGGDGRRELHLTSDPSSRGAGGASSGPERPAALAAGNRPPSALSPQGLGLHRGQSTPARSGVPCPVPPGGRPAAHPPDGPQAHRAACRSTVTEPGVCAGSGMESMPSPRIEDEVRHARSSTLGRPSGPGCHRRRTGLHGGLPRAGSGQGPYPDPHVRGPQRLMRPGCWRHRPSEGQPLDARRQLPRLPQGRLGQPHGRPRSVSRPRRPAGTTPASGRAPRAVPSSRTTSTSSTGA